MAVCGVCKSVSSEENDVKCSGSCGFVFHADCIKGEYEKKTRSSKDFKCKDCKSGSSQGCVKSAALTTNVITKDFILTVMEGFKKEVFAEMESFKKEVFGEIVSFKGNVNELTTSLQFFSDKIDSSCQVMKQLSVQFEQLRKENEEMKAKTVFLSTEVQELRNRLRNLEQYSRVNNIEINGLPTTKDESVRDLLKDVAKTIGVEVQSSDISAAHRVPSFKKDRDPALIIQFTNRTKKEEWINKFRAKKTVLTAQQVNQRFPAQRVYLNDHLSPENKQLLSKLKLKCKEIGYTYAWSKDVKFFARKAEGDPIRKITSFEDIEKLK